MKNFLLMIIITSASFVHIHAQGDTLRFEPGENGSDSLEYELIVMDPGYELFLHTQKPMNFYSQQYYETWNAQYVAEWNSRHMQPLAYGGIYETYIDYRPGIDYGLELNYKLYYYFKFFEKEHGVNLVQGKYF